MKRKNDLIVKRFQNNLSYGTKHKLVFWAIIALISIFMPNRGFPQSPSAEIYIYPNQVITNLNQKIFGNNISASAWECRKNNFTDEVIKTAIPLNISVLRFPGGGRANQYIWNAKELHSENGCTFVKNEGKKKLYFVDNTDEFIDFSKTIRSAPMITLNLYDAVKNQFEWVRYANQKKLYGIKYWELGNEIYWHKKIKASEYQDLITRYYDELKRINPTTKVSVCAGANPSENIRNGEKDWLKAVAERKGSYDAVSIHLYWGGNESVSEPFSERTIKNIFAYTSYGFRKQIDYFLDELGQDTEIWLTEWNFGYYKSRNFNSLLHALYVAEILCQFSLIDNIKIATFWDLKEGPYDIFYLKKGLVRRPPYYIFKLFADSIRKGMKIVKTTVEGGNFTISNQERYGVLVWNDIKDIPPIPYIQTMATINQDLRKLYLLVINRDIAANRDVLINISEANISNRAKVYLITGQSIEDRNEVGRKKVVLKEFPYQLGRKEALSSFTYVIPKHSVISFELTILP